MKNKKFLDIMSALGIFNCFLLFIRLSTTFITGDWNFDLGINQFKLLICLNLLVFIIGYFSFEDGDYDDE